MIGKEILRQIVFQQKSDGFSIEDTVKRETLEQILGWFKDNRIIIITGIRRSGKSTILKQIMQNKADYCYVNFEDERFIDFKAQDFELLNEVLTEVYNNPKIYFFDEIQNIEKFEIFVVSIFINSLTNLCLLIEYLAIISLYKIFSYTVFI